MWERIAPLIIGRADQRGSTGRDNRMFVVIGSNLFNLLAIGGVTASLVPLPVPSEFLACGFWVMTAAAVSLLAFALLRRNIRWLAGFLYLSGYVGYLTSIATTRA